MKIAEIFESISGEPGGFATGQVCTFIRLQGCNLKCDYCDSPETQDLNRGKELELKEIVDKVEKLDNSNVLITGGEPLFKCNNLINLVQILNDLGFIIQIETNGTIKPKNDLYGFDINWVVDYKNGFYNFLEDEWDDFLFSEKLYLKFIIKNQQDIDNTLNIIKRNEKTWQNVIFIFSPMNNIFTASKNNPELVKKIFESIKSLGFSDRCIIGHQLHKIYELK